MYILKGLLYHTWVLLSEMAPYILFGLFIAGVLHVLIPGQKVYSHLSGRNIWAVLKASLLGVPLPLCSCGVIPVAAHLRKQGAAKGATLAFLISTPTSGVDSILATYGLLGPVFAVIRPLAAFVTGFAAGLVANLYDLPEEETRETTEKTACTVCGIAEPHSHSLAERIGEMFRYAFRTLLKDIGKWLLIGILTGGAISFFIPAAIIDRFLGSPLLAYPVMLAIGIPMYVCATGSIPIAASLIMKGMTPGAGLIFLIAGPATNTATLSFVGGRLGKRALLIYLFTIISGALVFAALMDIIWSGAGMETALMSGSMKMLPAWLKSLSSILLIVLGILPFMKKGPVRREDGMAFRVEGMTCDHCRKTVSSAVMGVPGVRDVHINLQKKRVYVYGGQDPRAVIDAIQRAGYKTCEDRKED